jgi:hypothetical protein
MKKIISIALGLTFATTLIGTTFASYNYNSNGTYCTQDAYVCPDGTSVGRTGSNCQFVCPSTPTTTNNSYTYTSGCYTYYYNASTLNTSVVSYNCSNNYNNNYNNNNYNNNYNNGYTYTAPSTSYYYYTTPSSYYTSPYYTYQYQNGSWYPSNSYNNTSYTSSYYTYPIGYTDTGYNYGYNNYNYGNNYNDGFIRTPTNPCYYQGGYQVCY